MEDFNLVTISHLQMAGEESAILKIPQEEYEAIVAKYGTKRQFLKYDSNYFDKAQKAAMPEEELSKLYVSHASTEGFEGGLVIFTRFLSMMQEAMLKHKTFRAVINYDAEKLKTGMFVYTPKESDTGRQAGGSFTKLMSDLSSAKNWATLNPGLNARPQ